MPRPPAKPKHTFKKVLPRAPRQWAVIGEPESGKTLLLTQMKSPILSIDPDHRFGAALRWLESKKLPVPVAYSLSENPLDHLDALRISECLSEGMASVEGGVGTIAFDSLTNFLTPMIAEAQLRNARALESDEKSGDRNLMAGFGEKAKQMKLLITSLNSYGCDVVYTWHKGQAGVIQTKTEEHGAPAERLQMRETISKLERARMLAELTVQLEVLVDPHGKRGIKVMHCRDGREGMTLWDDSGYWKEMPERIEEAMYGGLTDDERTAIAQANPKVFPTPEQAIAWAVQQGAYKDVMPARQAYERIKTEGLNGEVPKHAIEMATLWVTFVLERKKQLAGEAEGAEPAKSEGEELPF